MQLNFRRSETTWMLCQQEFLEQRTFPDIILVQDPPSSVMGERTFFLVIELLGHLVGDKG